MALKIKSLGQSGYRLQCDEVVVYIDPYLSDSVASMGEEDLRRMVPIPVKPENIKDADWVLLTHHHRDHYDPDTIGPLSISSPGCRFVCPGNVVDALESLVDSSRIIIAEENWIKLAAGLRLLAVPAAHPEIERDKKGHLQYVGYVLECGKKRLYHAGDTSPDERIIKIIKPLLIDIAMIPVNEKNYFRNRRGIIGNMSVREAFQFAEEIGVKKLIPMHWDMFKPNSVSPEEISLLYHQLCPAFKMLLTPVGRDVLQ